VLKWRLGENSRLEGRKERQIAIAQKIEKRGNTGSQGHRDDTKQR
jgi:hypothetical protein